MNAESFTEMMHGAVIMSSLHIGSQNRRDNTALPLNHPEPLYNACEHLKIPGAREGLDTMKLVGGTDMHPTVAAVDFKSTMGHQTAGESQVKAPVTGMSSAITGPDGHSV